MLINVEVRKLVFETKFAKFDDRYTKERRLSIHGVFDYYSRSDSKNTARSFEFLAGAKKTLVVLCRTTESKMSLRSHDRKTAVAHHVHASKAHARLLRSEKNVLSIFYVCKLCKRKIIFIYISGRILFAIGIRYFSEFVIAESLLDNRRSFENNHFMG